ncbi:glycosyltransferase [Clostridium perfringens]
MKKIMFMIPSLGSGGAETILVDILNKFDNKNLDITLIVLNKSGENLKKLTSNYNIIFLNNKNNTIINKIQKFTIKYFPKFFYCKNIKNSYDIEIAFLEGLATKVIANSTNKKSKKIAWVHCDLKKYNWVRRYFKNNNEYEKVYNKFNDIIFVSKACKNSFESIIKNNSFKKVIYNPINKKNILSKSKESKIYFKRKTIVAIGTLSKVKGFERLIDAYINKEDSIDYDIKIIGDGPEKEFITNKIKQNNLENNIELIGFKKNPYPYILAADIIVSTSYSEAYPSVLIEALILSKPIIASNIDANNEILDNGKYGLIWNDIEDLSKKIELLLRDEYFYKKYCEASKLRAKELSYEENIKIIEDLFN